jgi:hypothetical protein
MNNFDLEFGASLSCGVFKDSVLGIGICFRGNGG